MFIAETVVSPTARGYIDVALAALNVIQTVALAFLAAHARNGTQKVESTR